VMIWSSLSAIGMLGDRTVSGTSRLDRSTAAALGTVALGRCQLIRYLDVGSRVLGKLRAVALATAAR
jgi:hypothetical protein